MVFGELIFKSVYTGVLCVLGCILVYIIVALFVGGLFPKMMSNASRLCRWAYVSPSHRPMVCGLKWWWSVCYVYIRRHAESKARVYKKQTLGRHFQYQVWTAIINRSLLYLDKEITSYFYSFVCVTILLLSTDGRRASGMVGRHGVKITLRAGFGSLRGFRVGSGNFSLCFTIYLCSRSSRIAMKVCACFDTMLMVLSYHLITFWGAFWMISEQN